MNTSIYPKAVGLMVALALATAVPGHGGVRAAEDGSAVVESRDWDGIGLETELAFERARLVVTGQDGHRSVQYYGPGESLFVDAAGLADGAYRYEARLYASEAPGGVLTASGSFSIRGGVVPATLEDGAVANTVDNHFTGSGGFSVSALCLGCGSAHTPRADLDIFSFFPPVIRLEQSGTFTDDPGDWEITASGSEFRLEDLENGTIPVRIAADAPTNSLVVEDFGAGRIGLFTFPAATLHLKRDDGTAQVLVEETSAGNRTLIQLTNNGRPQVRLSNTATGVNWVTGMGTDDAYIIRRGSNEYRFTKGGRVRWFLAGVTNPIFDFSNTGNLRIAGSLTENSDVNAKRDVVPVDGKALLQRVAALPVSTWSYRDDETGARHVGPMAQDFHAAFGLGVDDTSISPRDVAGVALAAVQELLRRKDAEIAALRARQAAFQAQQAALLDRLEALEAQLAR